MTRLRFTLAQLIAAVIFIGLGFAALRSASPLWSSAVFTLTVTVLSAAILGAMARRGRARMTWAGFALFGWVYLGTAFGPWADVNGVTAPPYVTRLGLDYWHSKLPKPPGAATYSAPAFASPAAVPLVLTPDALQFRRIGHCLAAILFGLVGTVLGRLIAAKDDQPNH
jgi:hypothetical protein